MEKKTFIVMGGIGDILLAYDGIKTLIDTFKEKNLKCYLFSHFKHAPDLLSRFYFEQEFIYYKNQAELDNLRDTLDKIQSDINYVGNVNDFNNSLHPLIENKYQIIGIHPFGSEFSNDFLVSKRNVVRKDLSLNFVVDIVNKINKQYPHTIFMIFGSDNEYGWYYKNTFDANATVIPVFNSDINATISLVRKCDLVIAADSAIKSISCIMHIPTIILVGDYKDPIRDEKFIIPYTESGDARVIKFSSEEDLLSKTTQIACEALSFLEYINMR